MQTLAAWTPSPPALCTRVLLAVNSLQEGPVATMNEDQQRWLLRALCEGDGVEPVHNWSQLISVV